MKYSIANVSHLYGNNLILSQLNLEFPVDGIVVVVGPSGSGKSTLLRLLGFLEEPVHGEILLSLGEQKYSSSRPERPWPRLTCVFQNRFLWPHLTIRQNIELPLRCQNGGGSRRRLDEVIKLFDMSEFENRYPNEVSGGQAQRTALARALALNPSMLLIDEAHTGLDVQQIRTLNQHLIHLNDSGIGIVIVTHSVDFARKYGEFFIVMEHGKIVEWGDREVLRRPKSIFLRGAADMGD